MTHTHTSATPLGSQTAHASSKNSPSCLIPAARIQILPLLTMLILVIMTCVCLCVCLLSLCPSVSLSISLSVVYFYLSDPIHCYSRTLPSHTLCRSIPCPHRSAPTALSPLSASILDPLDGPKFKLQPQRQASKTSWRPWIQRRMA